MSSIAHGSRLAVRRGVIAMIEDLRETFSMVTPLLVVKMLGLVLGLWALMVGVLAL